jgi:hypothetical protein
MSAATSRCAPSAISPYLETTRSTSTAYSGAGSGDGPALTAPPATRPARSVTPRCDRIVLSRVPPISRWIKSQSAHTRTTWAARAGPSHGCFPAHGMLAIRWASTASGCGVATTGKDQHTPGVHRHRHHVCHERHRVTGTNSLHGFHPSPKNRRCPPAVRATPGSRSALLCHGDAASARSRRLSSILRIIQTSPNSTSAEKAMVGESHR